MQLSNSHLNHYTATTQSTEIIYRDISVVFLRWIFWRRDSTEQVKKMNFFIIIGMFTKKKHLNGKQEKIKHYNKDLSMISVQLN